MVAAPDVEPARIAVVVPGVAAARTAVAAGAEAARSRIPVVLSAASAPPVDHRRRKRGSASPLPVAVVRRWDRTCRSLRSSNSSWRAAAEPDLDRMILDSHLAGASTPGLPPPAWQPTRHDFASACPCAVVRSDGPVGE